MGMGGSGESTVIGFGDKLPAVNLPPCWERWGKNFQQGIGVSSNGRTPGSGPGSRGSSPCTPAKICTRSSIG